MRLLSLIGVLSLASLASVAACSSTNGESPLGNGPSVPGPAATASQDLGALPCDVDAVLAANCRSCHASPPKFGAPMPLVTRGDLFATASSGKKVFEEMGVRIHDDQAPMPQAPNPRLSAADTGVLDAWIAAGAPGGAGGCGTSAPPTDAVQPLSCAPDQHIAPASSFAMTDAQDLYVCYGFDTEAAAKRHVIAGAPRIDNTKIVHHILLYQADTAVSPTPSPCGAGGGKNWRLVTGWAPGGKNFELPPEAGFAEEQGTTHWAVQIHYNNAQGLTGQLDASGYDLCSTDQLRPNDADILATGSVNITIPPRSTTTTTCDFSIPAQFGSINVISTWPHMHRLGRAESATRVRAGAETTLLDSPTYDFSTGAAATAVSVPLAGGDHVKTTCRWSNTSDTTVSFGERTEDEMCFAFLTYYPKIQSKSFNWALPAALGSCTSSSQGN